VTGVVRSIAFVLAGALSIGALAGCAGVAAGGRTVAIAVRYSAFSPADIRVPAGVPITFRLVNDDPIDHEWIVGDEALHAAHRTGTEPAHDSRPTEVTIPALGTRTTTVTFDRPATLQFVCHLPGHEAYGMVGVLTVVP
jgi:uncharacterized cupredoxin-like copper-binding protein